MSLNSSRSSSPLTSLVSILSFCGYHEIFMIPYCNQESTGMTSHQDNNENADLNDFHVKLESLLSQTANKHCADCGSPEPKWVSLGPGAFICIKCSGVHRSLGAHITKVISVNLDEWTEDQVDELAKFGGNLLVNKNYEAYIPKSIRKPTLASHSDERIEFIRRKYEIKQFMHIENVNENQNESDDENEMCCLLPQHPRSSPSKYGHTNKDVNLGHNKKNGAIGRRKSGEGISSKKNRIEPGMIEFIGLINIKVLRGTHLAIRDVVSSDPYVIISLGQQVVKTRVIKNNLNPVWNEKLMLSIPHNIPPLNLHVYDKDTFSMDDFMGKAEIDILPLVNAAKDFERSKVDGSKEPINTIDNTINVIDEIVKQVLSVKLQNVESGILDLELECVPLTQ